MDGFGFRSGEAREGERENSFDLCVLRGRVSLDGTRSFDGCFLTGFCKETALCCGRGIGSSLVDSRLRRVNGLAISFGVVVISLASVDGGRADTAAFENSRDGIFGLCVIVGDVPSALVLLRTFADIESRLTVDGPMLLPIPPYLSLRMCKELVRVNVGVGILLTEPEVAT